MAQFINTFSQGLDKDSSKNRYDDVHYFDAKNIRVVTKEGLSSGAIENILGNVKRVYCNNVKNHYIVGYCTLRDNIILFTTTNSTTTPNDLSTDTIWKIPFSSIDTLTSLNYLTLDNTAFHLGGNFIYSGNLGFCTSNKIRAVGRYENEYVQKVYWVDGYNNLRHLNTVHDDNTNNLTSLDEDKLELISNFDLTRPELDDFESGNLRSGKIQYTYQLYVLNGGETVFSPLSNLINLTGSNEQATSSDGYMGSDLDDLTGKAVKGTIEITSTGYNRIRIVAVHYTTLQGDPEIRIIEEKDISTSGETISFIDSGQSLGGYTLEEIRTLGTFLFSPKEIVVKDNILFPANITEKSFDIDFDARAYRFAGESSVSTEPNYQYSAALRQKCRIYDDQGNYYEGNGLSPTGTWTGSGISNITGWENIPEDFDAINRFNDIDNDGDHDYRFMYQTDGVTIGGEGPNVKYRFKIKTVELDDNSGVEYIKTGLEGSSDNPSYNNYASPYQCAQYQSYARDEVYRFGIVFFDDKGRSSFVKWIGDIRTPSISTIGSEDTYSPDGGAPTYQTDRLTFNDYYNTGAEYVITIDNNPVPTGYATTLSEISPLDTMYGVMEAFNYIDTVTISNIDDINHTFDITYNLAGSHTVQISRYAGDPLIQVAINYSVATTQSYVAAVGSKKDFTPVYTDNITSKVMMNILYPEFTVNLTGTEAEGLSYQIVRVRRESNDRSVRAQGIVTGTYANGNNRYPYAWNTGVSWDTSVVCFNSPEIAFNKNLYKQSGDKLQIVGTYSNVQSDLVSDTYRTKYKNITALADPQQPSSTSTSGDEFYSNNSSDLSNGIIVTMDTSESFIGTKIYHRGLRTSANVEENADKGTNFVCELESSSWEGYNTVYTARHLVNYKRNVFNVQYGGNNFESRSRNIYMAVSRVQKLDEAIIPVFGGDTYIAMFDYLHAGWKEESATGKCEISIFPVETSINLDLRNDLSYHVQQSLVSSSELKLMRELKGIHTDGSTQYAQPTDLYIYNTVYSKENTTKIYLTQPFDWRQQTVFDTRVLSSKVKINNEFSDSWLIYGANAYIDVDSQYGEITALINTNNQILFFQPKAFGTLSVNERALIQTSSISQLSLGTSGVLARFDYAKTKMGLSHRDHIVLTQNGLYWIDIINKSMYKFTNGPEEVSLMKGMDSWFNENLNNVEEFPDLILFNDPKYKEISIVYKASGYGLSKNNFHLVYNEITDSFISFYTYYPLFVINYEDKVLSTDDRINLYKHNDVSGTRCIFYGQAVSPSNITLIVNPDPLATKVFNNLEWLTEVYDEDNNVHNESFTSLRITNDYQDTGVVSLTSTNLKRRLRRWRYTIGRALYTETGANQTRNDARIRDSYMKLKLEFNNASARRFIAHDIITSYMVTNR